MSQPTINFSYECVEEVPLHRVRGNQLGILLSVIATVITQQWWILILPLAVQLVSRTYGVKYNLFVRLFAPMLPKSRRTEARELLRFNNLLAILFLVVTLAGHYWGLTVLSYIALGMLAAAVIAALSGFCLGCFMYFQYKQFRLRHRRS
ncbi:MULTISPECIES: DUF4395 domain-containing protein [unclassified Paenibacillus]|uniref:DUF4395 domain-containing protein n=1 Tax=unclassified Paenibacillus TaxID=185978 RepID=UPI0010461455|nr:MULTISPECIES: DUF4395 domain-containing protein [unclassified Paenibacillus]NIK69084.1 FtsH-binding integral membrane protein [Paenibacillus sp. BK720]TCM89087.1 uncharacterized protein DUF4395 [Paenibacillus sp. BK033]